MSDSPETSHLKANECNPISFHGRGILAKPFTSRHGRMRRDACISVYRFARPARGSITINFKPGAPSPTAYQPSNQYD